MTAIDFKLPLPSERVYIMGRTGSGKTRAASYLFSFSPFHKRPYVMVDFKGEDLFSRIERAREIGLKEIPRYNGLYYLRPSPHQEKEVEAWLWKIWEKENIGLYFDEGYMIHPRSPAFNAILTQGRSKKISCMTLTQRPRFCSRFLITEADYLMKFSLTHPDDEKYVNSFVPYTDPVFHGNLNLAAYNAQWYDVKRGYSTVIRPVPGDDDILARYDAALARKTRAV